MATSTTIIAALKYRGGIVIASDSQASDPTARVRWPVEKLDQMGHYPCVIGFSGSVGMTQRARASLASQQIHGNQFKKRQLVQNAIERSLIPIYQQIKNNNYPPTVLIPEIALWGLAVMWAEDAPQILEFEINGDSSFHDYFHAIGSAAQTAYAIFRTLGGKRLVELDEQKAIWVMLRILRTCVDVELWGVSEPLALWVIASGGVRKLKRDEVEAQLQAVDAWEEQERSSFLS